MDFHHSRFKFKPIDYCDLDRVAIDLNVPEFSAVATLRYPTISLREIIEQRYQHSLSGDHLNLIIFDNKERACGWIGLIPCPSDSQVRETSTYLHPRLWGSGFNLTCQSLLWEIGSCLLNYPYLIISINEINQRSIKGHQKLFPESPQEVLTEPSKDRISVNIKMDSPPIGFKPLTEKERVELHGVILPLAGYLPFNDN